VSAAVVVLASGACSTDSPCTVPAGPSLHTLPVLRLIDIGHGSVDADGRFDGFDTCRSNQHPLEDGGCAAACLPPTMEVYDLGQPYGGGACEAEYGGTLYCIAYAVDGGVAYASGVCVD